TVQERVAGLLGLDPNYDRASYLPIADNPVTGERNVWAWPQAAIDLIQSAMLPGHVVQGGSWSPEDVTRMAMDVGMLGSGSTATRAAGAGSEGIRGLLDPSTTRIFAGEAAKTADKAALDRAKQMAEA